MISVKGSELQEGAAISIDNMLQGKIGRGEYYQSDFNSVQLRKCESGEPLLFLEIGNRFGW